MKTNDLARFILAVLFSIAVIGGFFMGKIPSEVIVGFAGVIITFYFEERSKEREIARLKETQKHNGSSNDALPAL
jgi:hypothetical protein